MNAYTLVHVLISLTGLASGLVMLGGWLAGVAFPRWTAGFLATTLLTSVTGFFFPFHGVTPGLVVGALSVVLLAVALFALVVRRLAGGWRTTFAVLAVAALYFNAFVLIAQLFQHTPALQALAPTQQEPPFAVAQGLLFLTFLGLGYTATRRFRRIHP